MCQKLLSCARPRPRRPHDLVLTPAPEILPLQHTAALERLVGARYKAARGRAGSNHSTNATLKIDPPRTTSSPALRATVAQSADVARCLASAPRRCGGACDARHRLLTRRGARSCIQCVPPRLIPFYLCILVAGQFCRRSGRAGATRFPRLYWRSCTRALVCGRVASAVRGCVRGAGGRYKSQRREGPGPQASRRIRNDEGHLRPRSPLRPARRGAL